MVRSNTVAIPDVDRLPPAAHASAKLSFRVADALGRRITDGDLANGDRLPTERDLAQHFNVSRPTMREALLALEVQGLVTLKRSAGIIVTHKPRHEIWTEDSDAAVLAVFEARRLFEGEIAAQAAAMATEDSGAKLMEALPALESACAGDPERALRRFHAALAGLAGNSATVACVERLWAPPMRAPRVLEILEQTVSLGRGEWAGLHRTIAIGVLKRDVAASRAAMNAFGNLAMEHLLQALERLALEKARHRAAEQRHQMSRWVRFRSGGNNHGFG